MAKKESESYYKKLQDLTIDELYCYGLLVGIQKPSSMQRKNDLIKTIVEKESTFLDNDERKFYFTKVDSKLKYLDSPTAKENFVQKTLTAAAKIKVEDVKREIQEQLNQRRETESSIDLNQIQIENDQIIDRLSLNNEQNDELLAQLLSSHSNGFRNRNNGFNFKPKLKYEPSHGIEAFIRSVEDYAKANDVTDKEKWTAVAKSALNQSEDGLLIQDTLTPEEEKDWNLFKNKLQSILGRAADYYRDSFRSFRRGSLLPGMAMSKLIQAYKRGFLKSGDALTDHDMRIIKLQFIESLDNPLRGLVKAEEGRLTFFNIAERAAELERCFGSSYQRDSAATIMFSEGRVQAANSIQADQSIQMKMLELLNNMNCQAKTQHNQMLNLLENRQNKNHDGNNFRRYGRYNQKRGSMSNVLKEAQPKLQGFCYFYVKNGACRYNNCRFKHDKNIPDDVIKAIK